MLPDEINLPMGIDIFESQHPKPLDKDEIKAILDNDLLRNTLSEQSIIIINDHHRSTPSGRVLQALYELYGATSKIDFIVIAGGSHEEPTDKQLSKLTYRMEDKFNCEILIHDPYGDEVDLVNLGTTSRGTDVVLHPVLLDYENIVCINSIEPHYFAGFTGGVKSIIPGLAAKTTIEKNHAWALSEHSGPTLVDNNPLQLDLWEGASFLEKDFIGVQMVNFQDEIFGLYTGELKQAFEQAKELSTKVYTRQVEELYDVIVSVVYPPLNRSLYQAQKGIENTRQVLNKGGEMILVADCSEGIGNQAFFETMSRYNSPDEVLESLSIENYKFGDHKAFKFASLAKECTITLVGELTLDQAHNVFANSIPTAALESHLSELSLAGKKIALVLDSGALTLSYSS